MPASALLTIELKAGPYPARCSAFAPKNAGPKMEVQREKRDKS